MIVCYIFTKKNTRKNTNRSFLKHRLLAVFQALKEIQSYEMFIDTMPIPFPINMPDIIDVSQTDGIKGLTENILKEIAKKCTTTNNTNAYDRAYEMIQNQKIAWSTMNKFCVFFYFFHKNTTTSKQKTKITIIQIRYHRI